MKIFDRQSETFFEEKVYGEKSVIWLHQKGKIPSLVRALVCRFSFISWLYGFLQKLPFSKKKIAPFIEDFSLEEDEFAEPESYKNFNDFFIRRLKSSVRPIPKGKNVACMPADARYLFFEKVEEGASFWVKEARWSLSELLGSEQLAKKYAEGSAALARLAPPDYHRFHFPVSGDARCPIKVRGALYSVNPRSFALNPHVLAKNKRCLTEIVSEEFGTVLMCEIGAVNVGSIHQTAMLPGKVEKGEEKGYFSFGASAVLILFEKGAAEFAPGLVEMTKRGYETYCKMGEELATTRLR